jgi:hypothetical protein
MVRFAPLFALFLAFSGAALAEENSAPAPTPASVGVATMLQNGTILVGVPGPDGDSRAQAVLTVEPGDSTYQPIIDHVGGLKPGETKPIPPWPDQPPPSPQNDPRPVPSSDAGRG